MIQNGDDDVTGSIAACGAARLGSKPGRLPKFFIHPQEILSESLNQQISKIINFGWEELIFLPDLHFGYDFPIGTIAVHKNNIFPSAIGKDIGCGMLGFILEGLTVKDIDKINPNELSKELDSIISFDLKDNLSGEFLERSIGLSKEIVKKLDFKEPKKMIPLNKKDHLQLGTLGGGNHFLEVGVISMTNTKLLTKNSIVVLIHSGSRGYGSEISQAFLQKGKIPILSKELEKKDYWNSYCNAYNYALINRQLIFHKFVNYLKKNKINVKTVFLSDHSHNSLSRENNVWIHQKGATYTASNSNKFFYIPGNLRDGTYIVFGKDHPESYWGLPHGAGRKLSRTAARKLPNTCNNLPIKTNLPLNSSAFIEEIPEAYKPIKQVLNLVEGYGLGILAAHIHPLITVKL